MTNIIHRIASGLALALLGLGLCSLPLIGQTAPSVKEVPEPEQPDYFKPESPALPAPKGLTDTDQGGHDKRLKGYRTPAGFTVEIVAESPAVVNPVGLAFADDGAPHVIEWAPADGAGEVMETFKYKDGSTRQIAVLQKKKKDVVKVLTSSKNNGVFDTAKVVLEDELSGSILFHDGWLYVSGRGTVRRWKQSKPGGGYDTKEIVAQGFGGWDRHQVSGMTIGHDGWLYITCGDGDNCVEGSDGSRATVLRSGAIFRCKPDGSKLHTFAMGFYNPHRDAAFDLGGNLFHIDADTADKGKFMGCRLMHVPEGADLGWRLAAGARGGRPDPVRGAVFGELPGKMPPLLKTGRGAPSGLFIYNDTRLPEEYRGLLFYPDADRRLIRAYKVEQAGASFKAVEEFAFMTAEKDERFRPCQMVLGPDGAIYIVDRRAPVTGKLPGDGPHGRIYRVSWADVKDKPALALRGLDSWAKIAKLTDEELIKTLTSEEAGDRERARRELVKRGDKNRKALIKLLDSEETPLVGRIAVLGALQWMYDDDVQASFEKALKNGDAELQRLTAEALGLWAKKGDRNVQNALLLALSSEDLSVRRAVAVAMGRLAGPGAADNLATTLSFDESKDVFLRDGILRGLEMLGKPGIDALIALADSGVQKDTDKVVEAFLSLRTREAFAALPTLLKHMHVVSHQRAELIRSTANYQLDPPVSLDPLVAFVASQAKETSEVKKALLEVLGVPGTVKGPKAEEWVLALLTGKDAVLQREAVIMQGATASGARLTGKLYLEKKLPQNLLPQVSAAPAPARGEGRRGGAVARGGDEEREVGKKSFHHEKARKKAEEKRTATLLHSSLAFVVFFRAFSW